MANDKIYVKIRTWDDMLQEYGSLSSDQSTISIPNRFTSQMEGRMPADRIIEVQNRLVKDSYLWRYNDGDDTYIISEQMIEQNYGPTDPRIEASIIVPTKGTKISEPAFNHIQDEYYLTVDDVRYLHSDMIIRTSTMPFETGYYPTKQSALFAKLRFERFQQKGLLHDFSKPTSSSTSITDSDTTRSS